MNVFSDLRVRAAEALLRFGLEGAVPPDLDLARFTVRARPAESGCDAVVDAALVYADALAAAGADAKALAARLAAEIARGPGVAAAVAAGPGFIEVTLTAAARAAALAAALRAGGPGPAVLAGGSSLSEARRAVALAALDRVDALAGPAGGVPADWGPVRVAPPHASVARARDAAEVCGADALRFALASAKPRDGLRLDLPALSARWRGNPAFAVPYAHARLRAALRRQGAAAPAVGAGAGPPTAGDLALLDRAGEGALPRAALRFPHALAASSAARSAHPLAAYLSRLADAVHAQWRRSKDQPQLRFVNEERGDLTSARLRSTTASALVLGSGLGILGVAAPDEMA